MATTEDRAAEWSFWIDRGGTFTDIVAWHRPRNLLRTAKVLSEERGSDRNPALRAIDAVLGDEGLAELESVSVRMGTTVATNALLTRTGDTTVLVMTEGLGDLPIIGDQARPQLFKLDIRRSRPLWSSIIEARERISASGEIIVPLDESAVSHALRNARMAGASACAIALMHGWNHPEHERRLERLAREEGFDTVVASHHACPLRGLLARSQTTVVDAALTPPLRRSIEAVAEALPTARIQFMQSNGGLVDATSFVGSRAILSGPAGGLVGAVETAGAAGFPEIVTFDMGGTSTDVAWSDGQLIRRWDSTVDGLHLRVPMLEIDTIAAGGGSICHYDGRRFRVGPASAGADPGPACYGRGGPATITDCHVVLGRLDPRLLPSVFGPDGRSPIDPAAATGAFRRLTEAMPASDRLTSERAAAGCLHIAVERMASAVRRISIEKGRSLEGVTLVAFGGAGGQMACRVAEALDLRRVLLHPRAGVLSALGMGLARRRRSRERTMDCALESEVTIRSAIGDLERDLKAEMEGPDGPSDSWRVVRRVHVQVAGWDGSLPVAEATASEMRAAFLKAAETRYGFRIERDRSLRVDMVEVEVESAEAFAEIPEPTVPVDREAGSPVRRTRMWIDGVWTSVGVWSRDQLGPSARVEGPAIISEDGATTIVEPDWVLSGTSRGDLVLEHHPGTTDLPEGSIAADAVDLEVFGHRFMSIAENMGATLQRTAHSVNIKERLDFSCAIFDHGGQLIANGPHVPVHLGSMDHSVQAVLEQHGSELRPGEAWLLNDPYRGGTHLPDLTVVTPVFSDDGTRRLFLVASRGHHADIGGLTPGSMPANANLLEEEGVVIPPRRIVQNGSLDDAGIRAMLSSGPYPARNPDQNLADLRAQLAANARGAAELRRLMDRFGETTVLRRMQEVLDHGSFCTTGLITRLSGGVWTTRLDDGAVLKLAIRVSAGDLHFDFTGTSPQGNHNFNAPPAVTRAAVLYVLRCLIDDEIPLNAGCLMPIRITIPRGTLLNPRPPAAVAAGNVETSQCVVDTILAALGIQAASQGSMNNITFGDPERQYYETVCGGVGAGREFDGADAVHVHMTNSRLTDPEVLEHRFPVRLRRFQIRHGSGGTGRRSGGQGVIRELEFLRATTLTVLAGRRRIPPFGMEGGGDGRVGRQEIIRRDGRRVETPGVMTVDLLPGDRFLLETPGGGGFGTPVQQRS